jgi:hypothetical protein
MATRSTIGILLNGRVNAIYCHWDGYPEGVGATLARHYQEISKVNQLIDIGNISSLKEEIGEAHDFNQPTENWCVAYGRDRKEAMQWSRSFSSIQDWVTNFNSGEEFFYLYANGLGWQYSQDGSEWISLEKYATL